MEEFTSNHAIIFRIRDDVFSHKIVNLQQQIKESFPQTKYGLIDADNLRVEALKLKLKNNEVEKATEVISTLRSELQIWKDKRLSLKGVKFLGNKTVVIDSHVEDSTTDDLHSISKLLHETFAREIPTSVAESRNTNIHVVIYKLSGKLEKKQRDFVKKQKQKKNKPWKEAQQQKDKEKYLQQKASNNIEVFNPKFTSEFLERHQSTEYGTVQFSHVSLIRHEDNQSLYDLHLLDTDS
eukprot:TRINITY_DN7174_c0_g1_i2.p1 TRINITY_DN7174_c0_g1~~TRINITY_DN7174_c0_g1_i2.p1  ORF type:complete len:238 (+),score=44.98 TRINITY_DN7174_c0_g1_i2:3-716(+)